MGVRMLGHVPNPLFLVTMHWGFAMVVGRRRMLNVCGGLVEHEGILIAINASLIVIKYSSKIDMLLWEP